MKVETNKVVSINYTLTDEEGTIIDTSTGREPLIYLHGTGNLIIGLEEALEGKASGEAFKVVVAPAKGYGVRDESLMQALPPTQFSGVPEVQPGMQFQANTEQGPVIITIIEVQEDKIIVDGNHPLAGVHLNFDVEIVDIREATAEELDHGHVHGPGGHHH